MKSVKKKLLSFSMTMAIILCMISMSVPVMAKENLPGVSQNTPIYTYTYKSLGRVYRYTNSSLTTKESGHWIDCATDLCRIIEIQNKAVKVIYPTSSGNRIGWFSRSEFCKGDLKADQAKYSFKATKKITTYRWKENNTTAGAIYNGDKVYLLRGDQNSSWLQVLYPVSGGYKMAWVKGADLFSKSSTSVAVTGVKLNKSSASVKAGSKITLTATISPSNATNKNVTWKSSNTKVATVSGGTVKGVAAGTATITAKSNNGKTATCKITVTKTNVTKASTSVSYAAYNGVNYAKQTNNTKRIAALDKAKRMVTIKWKAPCDFVSWKSKGGSYNTVYDTSGKGAKKFVKNHTYTGVPYSMAGRDWDENGLKNALGKGIVTSSYMKKNWQGRTNTTAHGVDCSKFVYYALKAANTKTNLSSGLTTSTIPTCGAFSKVKGGFSSMKPGDVINKKGDHVRLYVGRNKKKYAFFESAGGASRCVYREYTEAELKGYTPYRFKGFGD